MDSKIIAFAIEAHQNVNHLYDNKPYSVHLALTVSYALKYIDLVPEPYQSVVIDACWLHDTIEDTRMTYNDIRAVANPAVADIVYAVTNEKGKTRKDRANEKYYEGIKKCDFASFVKLCDRLANAKYSADSDSRMKQVYLTENEYFINSLIDNKNKQTYSIMIDELNSILS
jgi:(p)ppGpp synthase/HD superfamily hydrolase